MNIEEIRDHVVSPSNCYLFDTNVWLYIYGPMADTEKKKQQQYSKLLRDIVDHKAGLFITSMVLSEYINRVLRIGFEQWKRSTSNPFADYKRDFRQTKEYEDSLADVKAQVNDILSNVPDKMPDDFNSINVKSVMNSMSKFADFNDAYLVNYCDKRGICFVSDDKDIGSISSSIVLVKA